MKVLVTGANGMLGQDLCPILEDAGCFVIETDKDTLDITDFEKVNSFLNEVKPDMVVHCAAFTDVDGAEKDFEKAELINAKGTENIAKVCAKLGATLVYISTDYVFDGTKSTPYTPEDLPNPINNYGLSKLHGEELVKKYCEKYYIARTSWLYGHYGKNFVETMFELVEKKTEDGEIPQIKVVDDQIGCPSWTVDVANGITQLFSEPSGTYHVCGGGSVSWFGFAQEIFKMAEKEVNLIACTTEEFPRAAKRPKYSVMENGGLCRNWKRALKDYLELREV